MARKAAASLEVDHVAAASRTCSFTDGALETDVVNQSGGAAIAPPLGCAGTAVVPEVPAALVVPLAGLFAVAAVGYTRPHRQGGALTAMA